MLTHERQVRNTVLGKRKRSDTSSSDVDMPPRNTRMKSDNSVFHAGGSRINSRGGIERFPAQLKGLFGPIFFEYSLIPTPSRIHGFMSSMR